MSEWERKALEAADKFSKEEHAHRKTKKELAKIKADCDKYIQETGFKVLKLIDDNKSLQSRLDMAVECLKFYANEENYGSDDKSRSDGFECFDIVLFDFSQSDTKKAVRYAGKRAREVLKQIQGE